MNPHNIILRPVLSQKAFRHVYITGKKKRKYAFYVNPRVNRTEAKQAIETAFNVEVVKVNIANVKGKIKSLGRYSGSRPQRKKAIVTLKAGQRIAQLDGLIEAEG